MTSAWYYKYNIIGNKQTSHHQPKLTQPHLGAQNFVFNMTVEPKYKPAISKKIIQKINAFNP
jgi:hypothetical protein